MGDVKDTRAALLARTDLTGQGLRTALVELYDDWLADLLGDAGPGVALVAVGGVGRPKTTPTSYL
jgi:[protein-PII] uridylyltransferase